MSTPYNYKTIDGNLSARIDIIKQAQNNFLLQRELYDKSRDDLLFFINYFVWVFNPKKEPRHFPFVLYPVQEKIAVSLLDEIKNSRSSLSEKSRETGMTFLHLAVYLHQWLFSNGFEALVGSLKGEDVDDWTPSSLIGKVRYMYYRLPYWITPLKFVPRIHDTFRRFFNPDNESSITGRATTEDFGRGGRKSVVLVDEHASIGSRIVQGMERALPECTNTIHRVSTPKGINTFKLIRDRKLCDIHTIHWSQFPEKSEGLYYIDEHGNRVDCPDLPLEARSPYGYYIKRNGKISKYKLRSTWYDLKQKEYLSERDLAQELDINYQGSGFCRFNGDMLEKGSALCRDGKRGFLVQAGTPAVPDIRFQETPPGAPFELEVWKFPTPILYSNRSFIGADVAEGLVKGDYSSADVILKTEDGLGGFLAASFHGHLEPDVFADKLFTLGMWYDAGALLAVERNKDGFGVLLRLQNVLGYRRLYTEMVQGDVGGAKSTDRLGFLTSSTNKKFLVTADVDQALRDGELIVLSHSHYTELSTFENSEGKLGATGENFDDRVISLSIAWHIARQGGRPSVVKGGGTRRQIKRFDTSRY